MLIYRSTYNIVKVCSKIDIKKMLIYIFIFLSKFGLKKHWKILKYAEFAHESIPHNGKIISSDSEKL